MRHALVAVAVMALLATGCGGDDDNGGFGGVTADPGAAEDAGDGGFSAGGDGDDGSIDRVSSDPDGALAEFRIPSPSGALDGIADEIEGIEVASAWYAGDRFDELVDFYEAWFLDQGLIEGPIERLGIDQQGIQGTDGESDYLVILVGDAELGEILVNLSVSPTAG